ncbi:MAG: helix-turn-helix domain-containing protein, partial [Bacteroidota bacterium]
METYEIQQQFFNHLKTLLPPHLSLVDELSDLFGLSADSVYRRIRGEKPIALSELKTICEKYHLSLDHVLQLQNNSVVFQAPEINSKKESFIEYLNGLVSQLKYFNNFEKRQVLYLCKDLPFWHFYLYPELAAFKTFVWIKTVQNNPEYTNKKFSLKEYPFDDCYKVGQEMIKLYNNIPSIELWNY